MAEQDDRRRLRVVGCFLEYKEKFLILLRHPDKADGHTWGLPAGKVNANESDQEAVLREVREETGYSVQKEELGLHGDYIFEFPDLYLEFSTYSVKMAKTFIPQLRKDEHVEFAWVTAEECYARGNLIRGFRDLLRRTGHVKTTL